MHLTKTFPLFGLFISAILLTQCSEEAEPEVETPASFTINAQITGLADSLVFLMKAGKYVGYSKEKMDSTNAVGGSFQFEGTVEQPEIFYLMLDEDNLIPIFAENTEIKIKGNYSDLENIQVSGAPLTLVMDSLEAMLDTMHDEHRQWEIIGDYISNNNSSPLAPYLALKYAFHIGSYDLLTDYYNAMSPEIQQHHYNERLLKHLEKMEVVRVGELAPELVLQDTSGKDVSLSSFRGSYVMLDFWASWCGPCRAENPEMKILYEELKAAGKPFEIVGVGAETKKSRWVKAIDQDELPWINISDLEGFKGAVAEYSVMAIPHTLLLDPEGRIIARDMNGDEMRERIRQELEI